MAVAAPKDKKKTSARVNWLIRQLSNSNVENVYVRASWPGRAPATQALLKNLRDDPSLIEADNKSLSPVGFEVMLIHDMAGKFSGAKTFIEQLEDAVPRFYKDVGQHLRAYVPPPPKLKPRQSGGEDTLVVDLESESIDPVQDDTSSFEAPPNQMGADVAASGETALPINNIPGERLAPDER